MRWFALAALVALVVPRGALPARPVTRPHLAVFTAAWGINSRGDIVGNFFDRSNRVHGFLLHQGHYTVLDAPQAGPGPYYGTESTGINSQGAIVGYFIDSSNRVHGFLLYRGHYTVLDVPAA